MPALVLPEPAIAICTDLQDDPSAPAARGDPISAISNVTCSICFEMVRTDRQVVPCGHEFHRACLQPWLSAPDSPRSCPNCRAPILAPAAPVQDRNRFAPLLVEMLDDPPFLRITGIRRFQYRQPSAVSVDNDADHDVMVSPFSSVDDEEEQRTWQGQRQSVASSLRSNSSASADDDLSDTSESPS
ncbi:RING-type domain-containing protein [Plasmodiophora brassicae]